MKKNNFIFIIISIISISVLSSRTISTTLKDYAYDFSKIGYEISFPAQSSSYSTMSAGDYFRARHDGYSMKVRIESLSRNNKRDFVAYYNEHCKPDYDKNEVCPMIVQGEVELDEDMRMILTARKIDFYSDNRSKIIKSFD